MNDTKEIYVYTFSLGDKKYGFTSFHKSKTLAKIDLIKADHAMNEVFNRNLRQLQLFTEKS